MVLIFVLLYNEMQGNAGTNGLRRWFDFCSPISSRISFKSNFYIFRLWLRRGLSFRDSLEFSFFSDLKKLDEVCISFPWRIRFRLQGMGFFFRLFRTSALRAGENVLIKTGHSHFEWLVLSGLHFLAFSRGYKGRIMVFRASVKPLLWSVVEKVSAISPPVVYRRKGIALSRTHFFFKRGKKKFV